MIITQRDQRITLVSEKRRRPVPQPDPERERFLERCRQAKRNPNTVRKRMDEQDMTLEEALAKPPMARSEIGRVGKQRSHWRQLGDSGDE